MARIPKATPPGRTTVPDEIEDELPIAEDGEDELQLNGADHVDGTKVVEESVETLKAQLAEERSRREAAEANRKAADTQLESASERLANSQKLVIETALEKERGVKKELLGKITKAKEEGNYAEEADALDLLQQANLRISRLGEGKDEIDRQIEYMKDVPQDPVARFTQGMSPASKAWVEAHADYVTDDSKRADLEAAHFAALGQRLRAGTPEYFAAVETNLGLRQGQDDEPAPPTRTNGNRPPAAPPSRNSSVMAERTQNLPDGVSQLSDGKYRLSPTLQEYARISGLSNSEYLKHLLAIHNDGSRTH